MAMSAFAVPMRELAAFEELVQYLNRKKAPVQADGCIDTQKCHLAWCAGQGFPRKLFVTYSETRALEICRDYRFFDKNVRYYPAKDLMFYHADIHSDQIAGERLSAVRPLLDEEPVTIVTTVQALLDRLLPLHYLRSFCMDIMPGDRLDTAILAGQLVQMGFERVSRVEAPGQFSIRGGIIDVYNQSGESPLRIELWDDEIDSIRRFDPQSQRSLHQLEGARIYPAAEYLFTEEEKARGQKRIREELAVQAAKLRGRGRPEAAKRLEETTESFLEAMEESPVYANADTYLDYYFPKEMSLCSLLDYFDDESSLLILDEPHRLVEAGEAASQQLAGAMESRVREGYALSGQGWLKEDFDQKSEQISSMRALLLYTLSPVRRFFSPVYACSMEAVGIRNYLGNFHQLVTDLGRWKKLGYRVILAARSSLRGQQLARDLMDESLAAFYTEDTDHELAPKQIMVVRGNLAGGIEYPQIRFAILTESDIFGREKGKKERRRKTTGGNAGIQTIGDLKPGDYVVHEKYGVGIYRGLEEIRRDGTLQAHIKIEYAGGGSVYVMASRLDLIQKFAAKDTSGVKLNSISGREWNRTTSSVRRALQELAQDLVRLYAVRQSSEGFSCGPDTVWQGEFEQLFPFEETGDQLAAIRDVKADMESTKIMDRLLCGDVGFGKTEVAVRAAFKMVQEGRQVAVLVPTTILAQQHFATFTQRMKDYPVKIGVLSRFRTTKEIRQTLADLAAGRVDIVIGTHRLLSKDVVFHNLGLLVVDEEQRFGVAHKEKIKKMRETVDVLTLTATPIPRTMHMSLIGIRDISLLEEAPSDRLPIQTYVMEFSTEMVREAISRELARGGQVYYVFNRVEGIQDTAQMIRLLMPEARVAYAHGQMSSKEIEDVMYRFVNREIDVLVATTIVETGLDIPNVNTMIIQDADRFGLSQLYQLRGRVGRSGRMAYAFLMYSRDKLLKETAQKRLAAIKEFTRLGSGYRIAMRDLELRGAGSLLGEKQSGHIAKVGYDLYCKLLADAIADVRGESRTQTFETTLELPVDAYLPGSYIPDELQRLELYKKIAAIRDEEDYSDILDEMIDRFSDPPDSARFLLESALIKALAHRAYVQDVKIMDGKAVFTMTASAPLDAGGINALAGIFGNSIHFRAGKGRLPEFSLDIRGKEGKELLAGCRQFLEELYGSFQGMAQAESSP